MRQRFDGYNYGDKQELCFVELHKQADYIESILCIEREMQGFSID